MMYRVACLSAIILGTVFSMSVHASELKVDLDLLRNAKTFSHGEVINQATKNEQFLAYERICKDWLKVRDDDLKDMLKDGTSAGKLYAALLISETNCSRGQPNQMQSGFKQLKADHSKVYYRDGCSVSEHQVSEIAEAFIKDGKFQDFCISKWCKKPAP